MANRVEDWILIWGFGTDRVNNLFTFLQTERVDTVLILSDRGRIYIYQEKEQNYNQRKRMMMTTNCLFFLFLMSPQLCSMALVGGKTPMTEEQQRSTSDFRDGLKKAVEKYNLKQNSAYKYDILEITDATQQIVQGVRYEASIKLAPTVCRKNDVRIMNSYFKFYSIAS